MKKHIIPLIKWSENLVRKGYGAFFCCNLNLLKSFFWFWPLIIVMLMGVETNAQSHVVENVRFNVLEHNLVVIDYDLLGSDKKYKVDLIVRRADNPRFSFHPKTVIGDIGKGKFAGKNRKIVWSIDNDLGAEMTLDAFASDYYFVVRARRKRSSAWFWITAITGGAAWYLLVENPQF